MLAWKRARPNDRIWPVSDYSFFGALHARPLDQQRYSTARDTGEIDGVLTPFTVQGLRINEAPARKEADDVILRSAKANGAALVISRDLYRDKRREHEWLQFPVGAPNAPARLWRPVISGVPPVLAVAFEPVDAWFTEEDIAEAETAKAAAENARARAAQHAEGLPGCIIWIIGIAAVDLLFVIILAIVLLH